jgi:hypothetical protein
LAKKQDVTGALRKVHKKKFTNSQSLPDTIPVIWARITRRTVGVACMGNIKYTFNIPIKKLKRKYHNSR